ncbi:hypothetical protein K505DRAFT_375981 [Melanomma pulvis-pyrius CBS 109.77]|uniref:HECT-type E3 ubiquitin transferase n=1 Tax=Melanomma pulvis-pyrius CBS 109.77 TaxID=1314802 RepID=A0A6A6X8X0_9PLEO|nr:hypothetical protein K505DRAFT_375981 [Melanomma pulvis-pyrius CBS 109.77]
MKIKKQATSRHESTLSPMIADFVQATASIPLYQIPAHLASFPKLWPFPRGDTYHWIPVLNRFDRVLELFNKEYGLDDGPQTQSFQRCLLLKGDADGSDTAPEQATNDTILDKLHIPHDGDRELVEQILSFTRLLLENCGNRSLYSSSAHLDKLLNTTSTSLLKATLRLSLRLAQRYYAARMRLAPATFHPALLASHYNFNLDKVQKLAAPFAKSPASPAPVFATPSSKGKEKALGDRRIESDKINATDLVGLFALSESTLKQEFGGVSISFYEPSSASDESGSRSASTETPATPTPVRRTSNMRPNQTPRQPQTASTPDSPTTPIFTPGDAEGARPSGPKIFELSADTLSGTDTHEILKQGLADLPESAHYEYLHKVRIARALSSGNSGREDAVAIRLLAIANLGYVHAEKEFYLRLGQQDSDEPRRLQLAYQLSELVHPPGNGGVGVSRELQTFALNAIEALAKHKAKAADVCSALSVNVNHGVLFYVVRKAVAELGVDSDPEDNAGEDDWRDALFSLLNTLPTSQQRTGEGMVSAGLLEILVEVLKLRTKKAERNYPKVLNFLDTFVYNLRDAFSALVSAKGLDIIADLMSYEVETSQDLAKDGKGIPKEYKTQLTDYQIPFYHQQTLRWLFKFLNHMMTHTGGNFDRLMRNLIDSPKFLSGLRTVLPNATVFGSTVWSMAVNILTSFIHNEPTSYQVIVEAGLSEAFLETVANQPISDPSAPVSGTDDTPADQTSSPPRPPRTYPPRSSDSPLASGILPVAEAISTLPPAFGAICLNEAGMKLFQSSAALKRFFEIFESPAHVKALDVDSEIAGLIGSSFDELVRHHPPLKSQVLSSLSEMIARVVQLCANKAEKEGVGAKLWTEDQDGTIFVAGGRQSLLGPKGPLHEDLSNGSNNATGDVEMQDVDDQNPTNSSGNEITIQNVVETEDSANGPTTGQYISVVCRFLGGFFANHSMCAAFIDADGVESILDFATLPCLDPKFNESRTTGNEFGRVVQVLVEQKPHITVPSMLKRAQRALDRLEPLMRHNSKDAFFAPFTNISPAETQNSPERQETLKHGTEYVKSLVAVHTLVHALTLTFQGQMFNHRSTHNVSSQVNLADMYANLVDSLGRLHRSCVWEEILLQKNMPTEWEKETRIKSSGFGAIEADYVLRIGNNDQPQSEPAGGANDEGTATDPVTASNGSSLSQNSARFKNTQTLRYLLSKIPTGIAPFFQSLGKLLLFRRSLESYQKQCATIVADQLAQAAIDQLQFEGPKDSDSEEDRYAYWIIILTSMSQLMIENNMDRANPQALTLILVSFRNLGGLAVLAEILDKFFQSAVSIVKKQGDDITEDIQRVLNLSLGGVKIILAFYAQIINTKVINEASQTTSMQSRPERDRDRPDFFISAQFLVELKYAVIKPVREIWNSELIDKATTSIVKTSINILKTVLDGDAEHGAYKSLDKIPNRNKPIIKPWKPRNEDHMQRLKDAGYEESLAEEALYRCCDNFNTAREYCQNRVRDIRSSRNPIPQYELSARGPPSASPSRAEVVVPETADNASVSTGDDTGDDTGDGEDLETPDSQSVEMEDAEGPRPADEASSDTPVPAAVEPASASRDSLAYQKRMAIGNTTEMVAVDILDDERATLRKDLIDRSLDILNSHDDVTFELSDLISAAVAKAPEPAAMRAEIGSTLVQSLISLQTGDDFREQGKKIAASAHLLALVLQDKDFYDAIVEELKSSFSFLLDFIHISPNQPADESSPWIGQVLLIVERLLAEDQLPRQIQWTPPSGDNLEEISPEEIPEPIVNLDEKYQLFEAIMKVLPRIGKDETLALSVMRVLVMLTRTRKIAARLAEKQYIQRLFLMVRQLAGITNEGLRSAFMLVLRHIIEDESIIRQIMRSEIQSMFEQRDRRNTDTTGYTRQMFYLALRAPEIFVEVTNEKLQLSRFDPNQRPQTLMLKKEESSAPDAETSASAEPSNASANGGQPKESSGSHKAPVLERTKTSDLKLPVVENPDGVVHYLLCELLAYKEVDDKAEPVKKSENASGSQDSLYSAPDSTSPPPGRTLESQKTEKTEFKAETHPIYIYRCFILKCLAELLQSYNRTKIEFINFYRKADPHAMTPSKPRSGVLNYLLNALVPIGSLNHEGDLAFKKKAATSNCAIDVIVSLCAKTGEHKPPKHAIDQYVDTEPDLLFVRKFVLEHALKAFKDASVSDEPLDLKYSRLLNIADIFSRMVSQRPNGEILNQESALSPALKQMAKIMYEKNFITILTTAIADIDLNFPNAKRAVKYILKPLRWLCYIAVELSTQYDTSATPGSTEEYEISSASDDDLVGTTREETPDLFRNSTLGMYEPPHESESEPSDDEDDEEMFEEAFADDMEYEEDIGDDDVVSDEDEEMGDMGDIEGLPGDAAMGMGVEIEIGDNGEEIDSDDEDSEEDDDDDDDVDDDDDMDDMDDMDELEDMEDMEEITGDDENASLDDGEDSWSGDNGDFIAEELDQASLPPGTIPASALGFVLDPPQQVLDQIRSMDADLDDFMDDEMGEDEDDEEDEEGEDYDGEGMIYNPGLEDDEDVMPELAWGGWDEGQPPVARNNHRLSPWMFPGGPGDRILIPAYRNHRPGAGPRMTDDGVNPLLQRTGRSSGRGIEPMFPGIRNEGMSDWVHAIEGTRGPRFPADSPVTFISNLLNAMSQGGGPTLHQHNGALHLTFNPINGINGLPPPFDPTFRREMARVRENHMSRSAREDPQSAVAFPKAYTNQRWQEEARILYGASAIEKSQRVINAILKIMVPPAIEAAKRRLEEKEAEIARKAKEEQDRKEQKEREEREVNLREERERQALEAAEATARATEGNAEVGAEVNVEGETSGESTTGPDVQAMEGVEASQPTADEGALSGPSEVTPRITTNVRGREIDITELGIDLEYLEALPEELREEVLLQQVQEHREARRQAARAQNNQLQGQDEQPAPEQAGEQGGEQPPGISQEFLDALPPEIREELLQNEAQDRRRREREEARRRSQAPGAARGAEDMDPASFLASLDPGLRQAVLMEQDDDVLRQLPPEISAEARAYGGDRRLNQFTDYLPPGYRRGTERRAQQDDQSQKKKARPCVQMLDKAGVATLLRLMFIPQQGSAKASLSHILRLVCENRQNRAEVISILLSILQDGSADVSAVERSFAQLSLRAKQQQQVADKTPKASRKNGALSVNSEVSPLMVVQQCLHTLWQLTDKNPPVWSFFLTEHETGVGFKNRISRKGKAKETKATKYPLNALLSLLDRKIIIESSSIMEQLTTLLRVITVPLQVLKKEKEKATEESKKMEEAAAAASGAGQSANVQGASDQAEPRPSGHQQGDDTEMTAAPEAIVQGRATADGEGSMSKSDESKAEEEKSKKMHRTLTPPDVPENNLRLVAKILAARECNSKVFQETLSVISNLSPIPGAKEIFGKELLGIAQDLAQSTLKDLANLTVQVSNAESPTDVQGMALSKFSPASSDQAKLLRALTALDYLFDPTRDNKDKGASSADALEPTQKEDILLTLYENSTFGPLWQKLSECLTIIRQRGNMLNIATILLPLIEALMVVCKNTTLKDPPIDKLIPIEFSLGSPPPESRMESLFFTFTEDHRKILNDLVRQNPKLMSGTFSLLVKNSKVLEFDNKRNYFSRKLHSRSSGGDRHHPHPPLQLAVRRDQVFLDSFKSLYFKTPDEMKFGKLSIRFHGEEGVDAGGVTREWFQVIARQMFNADYALFVPVASDRTTFHPNRLSAINPEHLMFFTFIGRIIGKALYEGRVLDCHFSRAVYKRMLGNPVNLKDMETLDLEYHKSLQWMLSNDITDIITEAFSVDVEAFGETQVVDLIEDGRNIPVTEENKHEYVRLVTEHRLTGAVQEQLEHFLKGFHDIVPEELISIFSEQELELLISGLPDINVDDWKNNTEYHNYTAASPQIQFFWRAVRSFDKEEQAKLLQFVTGTSKVPLNGFRELEGMNGFSRFNIHRDYGNKDRLPSSHTCFNQLDLPEYETYEDLRKQLHTAITAGSSYFGFA